MTAILISGPASEPVSLVEMKAYLRIDDSNEEALITSLITAARLHVETHLSIATLTQSWSIFLDDWPSSSQVEIPISPLISVDLVNLYDEAGAATLLDAENYYIETASRVPRLVRTGTGIWPKPERKASGIEMQITVGYGPAADDVPQNLRQAIMILVAHWFENRELVSLTDNPIMVPETVSALLHAFRRARVI